MPGEGNPKKRKDAYQTALDLAVQQFRGKTAAEMEERAGAVVDGPPGSLTIPFLDATFRVSEEGSRIVRVEDGADAKPVEKILILHYLATAKGSPPGGTAIAFREIPGGAFYHTTYHAHTVLELVRAFGNDDSLFETACAALGAVREEGSGVRMGFKAFPRVPVTLGYWAGEEDMPAGAQVLFDASIVDYLPLEDIAVLGETLTHRVLEKAGRESAVSLYEYGDKPGCGQAR
ncbi:MAG: DUF3786 domain-containing protein [Planctomycetota bacterium]|jgi:hypothetical protein